MSGDVVQGECVVRHGHLRKLKTMKRKFFVLRGDKRENARLEYYESEKKFKAGSTSRRIIELKECVNITRRFDLKQRYVIALNLKDESFCLVPEGDEDLRGWLTDLVKCYQANDIIEELLHPTLHIWQVNVQKKGLGATKHILGLYNLCLTEKTLALVKIKPHNNINYDLGIMDRMEFALKYIRRCGDSDCFFYMEVGRQSPTGAGELWMHTDDPSISQSMHSTIYLAMSNCSKDGDLQPITRVRSSSTTDDPQNNPLPVRRQTYSDARGRAGLITSMDPPPFRNRCDSMPSRTCPPSEPERTPCKQPDHIDICEITRDEPDAADWHPTPRIPEEPDDSAYCKMMAKDLLNDSRTASPSHHSRASSLADEGCAYLSMSGVGYVEVHRALSPAPSSGSVCSGTPSTDPRFSEYQLEPATALIHDELRPPRAYSVGSRPAAAADVARLRAYSVGARAKRPPNHHSNHPTHCINNNNGKTSSVPLLPSTSSSDLMELDFSNNSPKTRVVVARTPPAAAAGFVPQTTTPHIATPHRPVDEYVDMSPRTTSATVPNTGYVEMRPTESGLALSPPVATTPDGYVEMNFGKTASRPISIRQDRRPPDREPLSPDTRTYTPLGSQTIFPLSLDSPLSPRLDEDELEEHHPLATLREISEEGRRSPTSSPPHYVTLANRTAAPTALTNRTASAPIATPARPTTDLGRSARIRKSSSPAPNGSQLIYAALELEPRGVPTASTSRAYTQIDFARSDHLNTADAN